MKQALKRVILMILRLQNNFPLVKQILAWSCTLGMDIDKKLWKLVNNIKQWQQRRLHYWKLLGVRKKRFPECLPLAPAPAATSWQYMRLCCSGWRGKPHLNISARASPPNSYYLYTFTAFAYFRQWKADKQSKVARKVSDLFSHSFFLAGASRRGGGERGERSGGGGEGGGITLVAVTINPWWGLFSTVLWWGLPNTNTSFLSTTQRALFFNRYK